MGLQQEGYHLEANFDHLPILQEDASQKATAHKTKVETVKMISELLPLSEEEVRTLLDL